MYSGLAIVLLPLIAGYLIPLKSVDALRTIHRTLGAMVYIILFFMGISLAFLDNLAANLQTILLYSVTFFIAIFGTNLIALLLLDKRWPWRLPRLKKEAGSRLHMILESLQLCGVVAGGFLIGLTHYPWLKHASTASEVALVILLLLIGIQLRNSGMTIKEITLNKRGAAIALTVALSAAVGGSLAALLLGLPINVGIAMSSGYGWYSLSGILLTDAFGPVLGSAAFFNDLARELAAILVIPSLIQRRQSAALGVCGATSMDFTLPVLQRSGGVEIVPAAIVHGFILSLLAPVFMALFSAA
ncbi:membrane protein [Leminorella grimontii]|uniref:Membrane protein n=1 Tax=Leminorella grimontii TaxID=82981 RepID=A0AAV5N5Q5_9GAMM|nr:lysine exporter LysO family protein [Leminorella grimontii]KFC96942.1 surface protein [Leminorella grimontii ATCC 33999 = DSM 5078]GKX56086.1 membrane protein [Leminorella grimontii]VFS57886.1 Membrane protein of uncharacterised function (DUF340) [Leminorella grimontii]